MNKKKVETWLEQIRNEQQIGNLERGYEKVCLKFSCKPDRKIYPYPKKGAILDEEKSVKWNKEEVERQRLAFENRCDKLKVWKNEILEQYEERIIELLAEYNKISNKESEIIWRFVCEKESCDYISEVVSTCKSIIMLYERLLELRKSKR